MVQRAENCSGPAVVARFLVAGVPVVQVVLVPLSAAMDALRGASDSVIAGDSGHSRCATEKGSTSKRAGYDGDEGFWAHFAPFFALLRLCRS